MKINELTGIKNVVKPLKFEPGDSDSAIGEDWSDMLTKYGFRNSGWGAFGSVWASPKHDYLLKVFGSHDVAYATWVRTSLQYKNNSAFPKFKGGKLIRLTPDVHAIRMERLTDIYNGDSEYYMNILRYIDMLLSTDDGRNLAQIYKTGGLKLVIEKYPTLSEFLGKFPDTLEAILVLAKAKNSNADFKYDLHGGNIMLRGKVLVFTDPLASKSAIDIVLNHERRREDERGS